MGNDLTRRLNFKIDRECLARLDRIADRTGLGRSEIARRCLTESLPKFERIKLPGSPREAREAQAT
jgi:predicted transcriptional regulator